MPVIAFQDSIDDGGDGVTHLWQSPYSLEELRKLLRNRDDRVQDEVALKRLKDLRLDIQDLRWQGRFEAAEPLKVKYLEQAALTIDSLERTYGATTKDYLVANGCTFIGVQEVYNMDLNQRTLNNYRYI